MTESNATAPWWLGLDKLMHEPGDRVRLPTARGVLDEVPPAGAVLGDISEQLPHDVELVVAREDLAFAVRLPVLRILLCDDLRVVLDDAGETLRGKDLAATGSRSSPRRRWAGYQRRH
jgi:hypothetical protein